jgi:dihydroneopterin aldolase
MPDQIRLEALELSCHIGVPEEERATPQRLTINLLLEPLRGFNDLEDRIENTVDYFALAKAVQAEARSRSRHLIETLAEDIAHCILGGFAVRTVELELRKYILPDTAFVAVQVRRQR